MAMGLKPLSHVQYQICKAENAPTCVGKVARSCYVKRSRSPSESFPSLVLPLPCGGSFLCHSSASTETYERTEPLPEA